MSKSHFTRFAAAFVGFLLACVAAQAGQGKVHPRVLLDAESGPTEFVVVLAEQADLGAASSLTDKGERGRYVYETLREVAARTQGPVLALLDQRGLEHRSFWIANMILVRGSREDVEVVSRRADVLRIDANPSVKVPVPATAVPEPGFTDAIEWGISLIGADQIWAMGYTGSGVVIGGQDTGYQWDHPALIGNYRGWNGVSADHAYNWHDSIHSGGGVCGPDSAEPCDDHNHGTHTMGTMVGDDGGSNRIGVAPGATWIGCRNMNQGNGTPTSYSECFQWFVAPTDASGQNPDPGRAPDVINNSWSCPASEGCSHDTLQMVVANTRAAGIVVVASAGNEGPGCHTIDRPPAIYDDAFTVGATDSSDVIATFSSRGTVTIDGSGRLKPDISAPGVAVRSSIRAGSYASFSGTSMAGPHVVGLVALMLDARPDLRGQVETLETLIRDAAVPLTFGQLCDGSSAFATPNFVYGHGRIDALETFTKDGDEDGVGNLLDCMPMDDSAWSLPQPVTDLALAKSGGIAFAWTAPVAGADVESFDLVRSASASNFSSATCVESGITSSSASDPSPPAGAQFYLVRGSNACGEQMGPASGGNPRTAPACP
jgi:subtilisin family serine protease